MLISGVSGEGVTALLRTAYAQVREARAQAAAEASGTEAAPEAWRP